MKAVQRSAVGQWGSYLVPASLGGEHMGAPRASVLIVEDDVVACRLLGRQLTPRYRVACAFDGYEGLQQAKALKPDVILTDTAMPVMSGKQLLEQLRADPELESTPVMVLSGLADEELRVQLLRGGARDYIAKPFAIEELLARVDNLVRAKRLEEELKREVADCSLLAEAVAVLTASLDYDETCVSVAELGTRGLADFCLLEAFDETGELRRLKVAGRDPSRADQVAALERVSIDLHRPHLGTIALNGEKQLLNQVSVADLESISQNGEHRLVLLALTPQAILSLPLCIRGRVLGSLVLVRSKPTPPFSQREVEIAEQLAHRATLALENARLYRQACAAIQARDDVLGMVAHDLRNPLNAMLLQLQSLRRIGTEPERRAPEPLGAVLREGARLNRTIEDLLEIACVQSGSFLVQLKPVRMSEIAAEAFETYRPLAAEAGVELRLRLDVVPDSQLGDRFRLHRAVGNLLGNAIQFTPSGGSVVLTLSSVGAETIVAVTDTGPGISPEERTHLFDRFWQAQKSERGGAGLGLFITKAIVEAHGGKIWVESARGGGSTFAFSLPLHSETRVRCP